MNCFNKKIVVVLSLFAILLFIQDVAAADYCRPYCRQCLYMGGMNDEIC
jgi:hypothetical protein